MSQRLKFSYLHKVSKGGHRSRAASQSFVVIGRDRLERLLNDCVHNRVSTIQVLTRIRPHPCVNRINDSETTRKEMMK